MFKSEGTFLCEIVDVKFTKPRFDNQSGPKDFDVNVQVRDLEDPTQIDWWRGEYSSNYCRGNLSHMMQRELTMQTLRKCGIKSEDLTTAEQQLVGQTVPAVTRASKPNDSGKVFYNISYIGSSGGAALPEEIDIGDVMSRVNSIQGDNKHGSQSKPIAATGGTNPFEDSDEPESDSLPF